MSLLLRDDEGLLGGSLFPQQGMWFLVCAVRVVVVLSLGMLVLGVWGQILYRYKI